MTNGNYTIKLLSNNIQYVWDGAMNNSNPLDGPNIQANFQPIQSMVIVGNTAYYNAGYNEGRYQLYKFDLSNINQTTGYAIGPQGIDADLICNIATDGTTLYTLWQTGDNTPIRSRHCRGLSFIQTYNLNFNRHVFQSLRRHRDCPAPPASPCSRRPAGPAVRLPHDRQQDLHLQQEHVDALHHAYLDGTALGWNTPKSIATTPDGDLWVTCRNTSTGQWQILRYTNFSGTPTLAATVTGTASSIRSA